MKKIYFILFITMLLCVACEFKLKPSDGDDGDKSQIEVQRYDRLESRYLTTGDFSALQQMNTGYPMETRTLIEEVLKLGEVNDPEINSKFLNFYQDTALQAVIADAEAQYANMDDINKQLTNSFGKLKEWLPDMPIPMVYAQISALDQSIIVGNQTIGISLDKYLGKDYPLYKKYYTSDQRNTMTRDNILRDCLSFYLLSQYNISHFDTRKQVERDLHVGKVQWVVNRALDKNVFKSEFVKAIDKYMHSNKRVTVEQLLMDNDYTKFKL